MTYCKDGSVINDHCCCDGSVNGELTIVLLDQQQSTKTFYILSLHYIHSMLQWLWKMEPSPWFLIDFFVFHFLQFLHAACVSRRVLRFDLRVKKSIERRNDARTNNSCVKNWTIVGFVMQRVVIIQNLKLSQLFIIQLRNNNSSKFKNTRLMKQFLQKKLLSMKLKFDVLL